MMFGLLTFEDNIIVCLGTQFFALLLTFFDYYKHKRTFEKLYFYICWGLLFSLYSGLSIIWASPLNNTVLSNWMSIVQTVVIGFIIISFCHNENNISWAVFSFVFAAFAFSIRFFIQVPVTAWGNGERFDNDSIFGSNANAQCLALAALFSFTYSFKKYKLLKTLVAVLCLLVSSFMGTRSGIVIFSLGLFFFLIFKAKSFQKRVFMFIMASFALIILLLVFTRISFLYNSVGFRLESMLNGLFGYKTDRSTSTRLEFIPEAIRVFMSHPLFGVGLDGFRYENSIQFSYAHNNYVEILADLGLVGFFFFYILHFSIFVCMRKAKVKDIFFYCMFICVLLIDFTTVTFSLEMTFFLLSLLYSYSRLGAVTNNGLCKKTYITA